jgi:hypothetical protein
MDFKMAGKLAGTITPELIGKVFEGLPSGTRTVLGEYGSPADWASKMNDQLSSGKGLPANFAAMDPSLQISFLVNQVVASGQVPKLGPMDPAGAAQRFGQALALHSNVFPG